MLRLLLVQLPSDIPQYAIALAATLKHSTTHTFISSESVVDELKKGGFDQILKYYNQRFVWSINVTQCNNINCVFFMPQRLCYYLGHNDGIIMH